MYTSGNFMNARDSQIDDTATPECIFMEAHVRDCPLTWITGTEVKGRGALRTFERREIRYCSRLIERTKMKSSYSEVCRLQVYSCIYVKLSCSTPRPVNCSLIPLPHPPPPSNGSKVNDLSGLSVE